MEQITMENVYQYIDKRLDEWLRLEQSQPKIESYGFNPVRKMDVTHPVTGQFNDVPHKVLVDITKNGVVKNAL